MYILISNVIIFICTLTTNAEQIMLMNAKAKIQNIRGDSDAGKYSFDAHDWKTIKLGISFTNTTWISTKDVCIGIRLYDNNGTIGGVYIDEYSDLIINVNDNRDSIYTNVLLLKTKITKGLMYGSIWNIPSELRVMIATPYGNITILSPNTQYSINANGVVRCYNGILKIDNVYNNILSKGFYMIVPFDRIQALKINEKEASITAREINIINSMEYYNKYERSQTR